MCFYSYLVMHCIVLYGIYPFLQRFSQQKRSRPRQLTLCQSLHDEALQATASEGLAQGPYVAARVGFNPRPSGQKASTLPMCHLAPQACLSIVFARLLNCFNYQWICSMPCNACSLVRCKLRPLTYLPVTSEVHL